MRILSRKQDKIKLFGITVLRVKKLGSRLVYYFINIRVWSRQSQFSQFMAEVEDNRNFDTRELDRKAESFAPKVQKTSSQSKLSGIAFLATELYDTGGHSKCLRELIRLLANEYHQSLFLTQYERSKKKAPETLKAISYHCPVYGRNMGLLGWNYDLRGLFYEICNCAPRVLFVFMHPDDVYAAMLLGMLKQHTEIKILYCPHASHYPNLGMSFADLSLEAMPVTAWLTKELRHFDKICLTNIMVGKKLEDFPRITPEAIANQRRELGLKAGELCVMSGGAGYKFFDTEDSSEYFQTIRSLLEARPDVRHVLVSNVNKAQRAWIEGFFTDSPARDRLLLLPESPDYETLFSCADLFLDSFPVSGALTMIDLMRLRVPAVVKINRQNAMWSFHEYQRPDFPYMYETAEAFLEGTLRLLDDREERRRIIEQNYSFYLERYEGNACKKHLMELIENADRLEDYVDTLPEGLHYQCQGMAQ